MCTRAKVVAARCRRRPSSSTDATVDKAGPLIDKAEVPRPYRVTGTFIPTYPKGVADQTPGRRLPGGSHTARQSWSSPAPPQTRWAGAKKANAYVPMGSRARQRQPHHLHRPLLRTDGAARQARKSCPPAAEIVWEGGCSTLFSTDTRRRIADSRAGRTTCRWTAPHTRRARVYCTAGTTHRGGAALQHIAKEARLYVRHQLLPPRQRREPRHPVPGKDLRGETTECSVATPRSSTRGRHIAGPLTEEEGILVAELDIDAARTSRRQFDPVGHYARPDVFRLAVNTRPAPAVTFEQFSDRASDPARGRAGTSPPATSG